MHQSPYPSTRPVAPGSPASTASWAAVVGVLVAVLVALAPAARAASSAPAAEPVDGMLCTGAGVNVVVDFGALGGGVKTACDQAGAGKTAAAVFKESGFALTPVASFPGAACRVDGKPAGGGCAKMPPADAYWGLYVAKGTGWDYAPKGADQLKMADGQFIAFAWQGTKSSTPPSIPPIAATGSATPLSPPSAAASSSSGASSTSEAPSTPASQQDSAGVPWWVPVLVVVVLVVAAGLVVVRRRGARTR